ncbi:MAG: MotA/TolQ/ExbB proton channel family protein, partial [Coriobacteriales bacterium]|nr:MotA/TolQ/ExbB proton channel family protein [Coriobacteriales bacterium]
LRYQKAGLITVARNLGLPEEPLFALAQVEINATEKHYKRRLAWTDTFAKIGPMLGLMGTLIPLGPGIVALGQGNTQQLSSSLLVAFDATVCGLVVACVALIISKIRSGWYEEYIETLESAMSCLLEKAAAARKEGITLPTNYAGDPLKEYEALKRNRTQKSLSKAASRDASKGADKDLDKDTDKDTDKCADKKEVPASDDRGVSEGRVGEPVLPDTAPPDTGSGNTKNASTGTAKKKGA